MKKPVMLKTILAIFILLIVGIAIFPQYSYADILVNPDTYQPSDIGSNDKLVAKGNIIIGVLQAVGVVLSVAVLIGIGIKYMLGSVEEKAQYKETMGPYLLGAVLVFGISIILSIIRGIGFE